MYTRQSILFVALVLLSSLPLLVGCSDLMVLKCADGNPVTVVKDISNAYPVYGVTYDLGVKATVAEINSILKNAALDVGLKTQITKFRDDLNQESSRYQDKLKSAVLGLQTAPCDSKNREEYWALMKQIDVQTERLSQIETKLKSLTSGPSVTSDSTKVNALKNMFSLYIK